MRMSKNFDTTMSVERKSLVWSWGNAMLMATVACVVFVVGCLVKIAAEGDDSWLRSVLGPYTDVYPPVIFILGGVFVIAAVRAHFDS
jgi:hypothetical protein